MYFIDDTSSNYFNFKKSQEYMSVVFLNVMLFIQFCNEEAYGFTLCALFVLANLAVFIPNSQNAHNTTASAIWVTKKKTFQWCNMAFLLYCALFCPPEMTYHFQIVLLMYFVTYFYHEWECSFALYALYCCLSFNLFNGIGNGNGNLFIRKMGDIDSNFGNNKDNIYTQNPTDPYVQDSTHSYLYNPIHSNPDFAELSFILIIMVLWVLVFSPNFHFKFNIRMEYYTSYFYHYRNYLLYHKTYSSVLHEEFTKLKETMNFKIYNEIVQIKREMLTFISINNLNERSTYVEFDLKKELWNMKTKIANSINTEGLSFNNIEKNKHRYDMSFENFKEAVLSINRFACDFYEHTITITFVDSPNLSERVNVNRNLIVFINFSIHYYICNFYTDFENEVIISTEFEFIVVHLSYLMKNKVEQANSDTEEDFDSCINRLISTINKGNKIFEVRIEFSFDYTKKDQKKLNFMIYFPRYSYSDDLCQISFGNSTREIIKLEPALTNYSHKCMEILFLDDEKNIVKLYNNSIAKRGIMGRTYTRVPNALMDLIKLSTCPLCNGPKLIVVDLQMPDPEANKNYDGLEVIKFIKRELVKLGLVLKRIKIVLCSGNLIDRNLKEKVGYEFDDYIEKPLTIPIITKCLKVNLEKYDKESYYRKNVTNNVFGSSNSGVIDWIKDHNHKIIDYYTTTIVDFI